MPAALVNWLMNNPGLVLLGILGLVLLAWLWEAVDEAEDALEAGERFGGKLRKGTGGALNVAGVSLVAIVGWAAFTFQNVAEATAAIGSMVPDAPVLAAGIFGISLGGLSLSGVLELHPYQYVGIAGVALALAVAVKKDWSEVSGR